MERIQKIDERNRTNWINISFINGKGTTSEPQSYSFIDNTVESRNYLYRLKQVDYDGTFNFSEEIDIEVTIATSFVLHQNYPNPFNPTTKISFAIAEVEFTSLKVYDVLGNEVATLVNEEKPAGEYEVEFNATGLTSGIYFYQLKAGSYTETKKSILLK